MKKDLYLISEAYKQTGEKWMTILKLRNTPNVNDYYIFKPLKDATDEEMAMTKMLIRMPNRTGKGGGGVRSSSKFIIDDKKNNKHTMVVMHVGPKKTLQDMIDAYKQIHKNVLNAKLIEAVPMKPKTAEHFGSIIQGVHESKKSKTSDDYVLFFGIYSRAFSNKFAEGKLMQCADLTAHEKNLLKMMHLYAARDNFKSYEMKTNSYLKYSSFLAFVGSEQAMRDLVKQYKREHGSDFDFEERKPIPMQKKTKKHFGDIMTGLKESKQTEQLELYALILHLNRKDDKKDHYFVKKLQDLNDGEQQILNRKEGKTTTFKQGMHKFREYFPDRDPNEPHTNNLSGKRILMYVAPLPIVQQELEYYKLAYGKNLEPGITVKPQTKELFGDILSGMNESRKYAYDDHVLMQWIKYDKNNYKRGEYQIKPVKHMTEQEWRTLRQMKRVLDDEGRPARNITHHYEKFDMRHCDEMNMIFGTKEQLQEDVEETKKFMMGFFRERMPMKPRTKESFADIFDALNESRKQKHADKQKQKNADVWVLIIKFQHLKSSRYNDALMYVVGPLSELSNKNKRVYEQATNWIRPAYNKKVEFNLGPHIGGIDMGTFKAEVYRGAQDVIMGELQSHQRIYNMQEEIPVPMKPETNKHFGDIV